MNTRVRVILPWIALSLLLLLQVDASSVGAVSRQGMAAPAEAPARSGMAAQDGVTMTLTYLPIFLKPECGFYDAQFTLTPTQSVIQVGDVITVTATLANRGCGSLGMPQYRVGVGPFGEEPALDLLDPEPITHYLGIGPEGSDSAEFALRAIRAGQAEVTANVSFEFHAGYPGPAYWGSAAAQPLSISVESEMGATATPTTTSPGTVTPSVTARATGSPTIPGTVPSLGVYKRGAPNVVQAGDVLTYTIVMMNDMLGGADPGASVLLTDDLPAYTAYITGSLTGGAQYDAANDRITWAGAIPQGLHKLVSFAVRVDAEATLGSAIDNLALIEDAFGRVTVVRASVAVRQR